MPSPALIQRAAELRRQGLTPLRTARRLTREFASAELFDIDLAAGLGPTGIHPMWAHGQRPVICRHDARRI